MNKQSTEVAAKWLSYLAAGILLLLPFHAFLTTWVGSNFGNLDTWRIWKELLIFAVAPLAIWLALKHSRLKKWLTTSWLPRLFLAYTILLVLSGVWALNNGLVNREALIYGILANLRFLGFFAVCLVAAAYYPLLKNMWWKLLLAPAAAVIAFGLLQLALPINFLTHFGYGPETIPAYQTIDEKIDYRRIQSTLRGANPLGSYLLFVLVAVLAWKAKKQWHKLVLLIAGVASLFFSHSRSAWGGLVLGIIIFKWSDITSGVKKYKTFVVAAALALGVSLALLAPVATNIDVVQNVLFHSDENSRSSMSSNAGRTLSLRKSALQVVLEPFGQGVGTAGPASVRNDRRARIAENYFLQLGQEAGWLAVGLFIAICVSVARILWSYRQDLRARVLVASLAGITAVNLVSHAWMDDTLSLLWWGLAGIVAADAILKTEKITNKHEKAKKKN